MTDTLPDELKRHVDGRLTVLLGAAPSTRKAYALLIRTRELRGLSIGVAIGIIDTKGCGTTMRLTIARGG